MKGHKETFGVMETCVTLIKVLVFKIYANVKNNPIAYFKYVQLTIFQLCLSKFIKYAVTLLQDAAIVKCTSQIGY